MWIDVLAAALLAAFVLSGALRGALASGLALLSLLAAYAAAAILAPGLGPALGEALELPGVLGVGAAGALVFLGAFALAGLAGALLRHLERRRRAGAPRTPADRALGAFFGGLRGGLVALLLGVLGYWLQALQALGGETLLPAPGPSAVAEASRSLVETTAGALADIDTAAGRMAVRAVARPAETFGALRGILDDPRIQALRDDGGFWLALERGDVRGALRRVSFLAIAYSGELRGRFAELGAVDAVAAADPGAFHDAMERALGEVAPRIRNLRKDPELQGLAEDPEVVRLLQAGDTLGLLRHPGFRRLVDRVTATRAG
jgi:membrane protein required for colicin V production